jgi:hypothetical protein
MHFKVYVIFYSLNYHQHVSAAIGPKDGRNSGRNMLLWIEWIKYIINFEVQVVGYLYIMDLINGRKMERSNMIVTCSAYPMCLKRQEDASLHVYSSLLLLTLCQGRGSGFEGILLTIFYRPLWQLKQIIIIRDITSCRLRQSMFFDKLDIRGSVHHSTISKENPTRCNSVSKFIIPYLYEA